MWLGSLVAMMFGLYLFRTGVNETLTILQRRFLNLQEPSSICKMLITTKLCAVAQGGFLQAQYGAMALLNSRSFSKRYAVLLLCLAAAGTWTTMVGLLMAFQVSGTFILGLGLFCFLAVFWFQRGASFLKLIFGLGLFLQQAEWLLMRQSILLSLFGESDFHFWLADGRFPAQLLWLVTVFLVTLIVQIESWAAIVALVLVISGSLSLNGAVAFIIGEMLAHVWLLMWRSRSLNQDARRLARNYAWANSLGLLIGFFAAGALREIFSWGLSFDMSQVTVKSLQFFVLYFVVIVAQCLTAMSWGHFAARKQLDAVQTGEYFSLNWIARGLVTSEILSFIQIKFVRRLDLLLAQQQNITANDRGQIPANFLREHEREINSLQVWLPLSRSTQKLF